MTKVYSGSEDDRKALVEKVAEAEANGAAETDQFSMGKVGDDVMITDKESGEVTKVSTDPETGKYDLEALKVKTPEDANMSATNKEFSTENPEKPEEVVANSPETQAKLDELQTQVMSLTEANKTMSEELEATKAKCGELETTVKSYADAAAPVEKTEAEKLAERAVACGLEATATEEEVTAAEEKAKEGLAVDPAGESTETKSFSEAQSATVVNEFEKFYSEHSPKGK